MNKSSFCFVERKSAKEMPPGAKDRKAEINYMQ